MKDDITRLILGNQPLPPLLLPILDRIPAQKPPIIHILIECTHPLLIRQIPRLRRELRLRPHPDVRRPLQVHQAAALQRHGADGHPGGQAGRRAGAQVHLVEVDGGQLAVGHEGAQHRALEHVWIAPAGEARDEGAQLRDLAEAHVEVGLVRRDHERDVGVALRVVFQAE